MQELEPAGFVGPPVHRDSQDAFLTGKSILSSQPPLVPPPPVILSTSEIVYMDGAAEGFAEPLPLSAGSEGAAQFV